MQAPGWMGVACCIAACSSSQPGTPDANGPSGDEAWVASACQPASIDTTGWRRYRVGAVSIQAPAQYTQTAAGRYAIAAGSDYFGYNLVLRGPGGSIGIQLHRNARYTFDQFNGARRGQNWCNGNLGGYQAEIVSWFEPFRGNRRDTFAGELNIGATYNFAARLPASWGGEDAGKWMFIYLGASRLRDAHQLRDALHTLSVARDTVTSR